MNYNRKIISRANKKNEQNKLNILTFATHERYEEQLSKTGHNFYAFTSDNLKKWNSTYASIPDNYTLMPKDTILDYIDFDLILSQDRFYQFGTAKKIQKYLHIPVVALEHTMFSPYMQKAQIQYMKNCVGDVNVFISEFSRNQLEIYHNSVVINHSVDTNRFKNKNQERKNKVLSVANDFINRDFCLNFSGWKRIVNNFDFTVVGDTPGLSEAATPDQLVDLYNGHSVFLNTSTYSPIPTVLLEAMSCGCAVVTTATCVIPEIIQNGVNGFISNDEEVLKQNIQYLFDNPNKAREIGENARQTILDEFGEDKFIKRWNDVLRSTIL